MKHAIALGVSRTIRAADCRGWIASFLTHPSHQARTRIHRRLKVDRIYCTSSVEQICSRHEENDEAGPSGRPPLSPSGFLSGTAQHLEPGLYLVPTPIGNLQDITLRALAVLRSVSLVLAEDTRHTRKLLNAYDIRTETASYHAFNERGRTSGVLQRLQAGEAIALVSDAGTPAISDPGAVLVAAAIEAGVRVIPLPGPAAFLTALVASGLPTTAFTFVGFLPPKQGARRARLMELRLLPSTLLFYAPPHGLRAVLTDMVEVLGGGRAVCVARELSKVHEEFYRSTLSGALQEFTSREPRGEICVVVQGAGQVEAAAAALAAAGAALESDAWAVRGSPSGEGEEAGQGSAADMEQPGGSSLQRQEVPAAAGLVPAVLQEERALQAALASGDALPVVLQRLLGSGLAVKAAAKEAARLVPGTSKKDAYALALQIMDGRQQAGPGSKA